MAELDGQKFFDEHMEYVGKNDIDGMIKAQYAPDAVLITFFDYTDTPPPHVIKGHAALKTFFEEYLEKLGFIEVTEMSKVVSTEDTIFFQARFNCSLGEQAVCDAWYMQDGKILRHFGGSF
jgi:hypothetical protein